ncbi:MAG TPA: M28 family peptidase [Bacteroidota bacterium]|nr:M28 family peptidase [Bacteroidota bacterium]
MWKRTLNMAGILLLSCAAGCSQQQSDKPPANTSPTPSTAVEHQRSATPVFDGERAFSYLLKQTSFGPRNPNSKGHAACRGYLAETLRRAADDVRLQEFAADGYDGETLRLTNIIAAFRPELKTRILLCAHWDTRPRADRDEHPQLREQPILGANDAASGVAILLELAALMKSNPPPVGVDIVLFDGEDYGKEQDHHLYLIGSRYFARHKQPDYVPRFGILLDMVGDTFLELPREMHSVRSAPDVVSMVWSAARELGVTQFVDADGEEILDDHVPLNEAGIKTIDIIDFNYPDDSHRYWHTHQDIPENCSSESLHAVGTVLTHVVYGQRP